MKYIYKTLAIITIFCVVLSGCSREEFLDIPQKGESIPSTIEDFRLLLDNSNLLTQKHSNTTYSSDRLLVTPEVNSFIGFSRSQLNLYLFKDLIFGSSETDLDWETYYEQIFTLNIILDGLSKITEGSEEEKLELEAEAKIHRAYAYFNLVNIYGIHYNAATASTDLGVPIREGFNLLDVDLTRASVQEVYNLVISDIESSIAHLQNMQPLNLSFRPSKAAAFALLSKVYLYQGEYSDALDNINDALDIYSSLRDINNEENELSVNPELPNAERERFWPNVNEDIQVVWHKSIIVDLTLSEAYGDLFETNDLRRQWLSYFPTNFENDDVLSNVNGYFLVANQNNDSGTEGIYTPDMYLIRAECNARLGNIQAANDDLNALREMRYETGTFTPITITDPNGLLAFVKDERRREFPGTVESTFDIKRYNLFDNDNITVNHTYESESVTVMPNSNKWAQPIGQLYINFNPEIEQNPRN